MMRFSLDKLGITAKVLVISVLPVVIVSTALAYYVTTKRLDDTRQSLNNRGNSLAKYLATMSEFGLFTGNKELMKTFTDAAIEEPDVDLAVIYDSERQPVAYSSRHQISMEEVSFERFTSHLHKEDKLVFTAMVVTTGIDVTDFNNELPTSVTQPGNTSKSFLGHVGITVSERPTIRLQSDIIYNSVAITLGGILISVLIALRIGRSITGPVKNLTQMEKELRQGRYNTRIAVSAEKELGDLEHGFNALAATLEESDEESRKRIQLATQELEKTVNALEQKNSELDKARQEALEASQAKADFLARMSHEIRTPMNAVIGFTNLLKNTPQNHDQYEYTRTINQAAGQLLNVIDDVLNFSKISSGTIELEIVPFDIRACFEDVISMLSASAHEKELELVLLVHSDVPGCLKGDPTRISQILTNLVYNAIKFTDKGGVTVQVAVSSENDELANIEIMVMDTGIGISESEQNNLFSAFSQADITISRRFGGTGLGLTIAKHFIDLMGGTIELSSEKDKGSTFKLTLPFEKDPVEMPMLHGAEIEGLSVLIHDTNPFSRRAVRNNLIMINNIIQTTRNVSQLYQSLDENIEFDLIILGLTAEEVREDKLPAVYDEIRKRYQGPVLAMLSTDEFNFPPVSSSDKKLVLMSKPARRSSLYLKIQMLMNGDFREHRNITHQQGKTHTPINSPVQCQILVTEDNKFNRILIKSLLQKHNIRITEAVDGQEAIDQANARQFDLIFMDIHLPVIDGGEATHYIRRFSKYNRETPIIALTADVFAAENEKLQKTGISDFLFKPVIEDKLWNKLSQWLPDLKKNESSKSVDSNLTLPPDMKQKLYDELPDHKALLKHAMDNNYIQALTEQAHKVCGVAGYFSIPDLEKHARRLETAARDNLDDRQIQDNYNNLISAIDDLLANRPGN